MIDFLLGVPGKLKTISDYLTTHLASTRAAKIDNLDAAVSTRAAAATALSTADWTPARAAKLDSVDAILGAAPKASGLVVRSGRFTNLGPGAGNLGLVASQMGDAAVVNDVNSTYKTLLSITGSGTISFLAVFGPTTNTIGLTGVKLTIDGLVVVEDTSTGAGNGTYGFGRNIVGAILADNASTPTPFGAAFGAEIPYKSSLLVEVKTNAASGGPAITGYYNVKKVT